MKAIAAYVGAILALPTADRKPSRPAANWQSPAGSRALGEGAAIACRWRHHLCGRLRILPRVDRPAILSARHSPGFQQGRHDAGPSQPRARHPRGHRSATGSPSALMPGFADALSDAQVASLMAYVRTTFSDKPAWDNLEEQVRSISTRRKLDRARRCTEVVCSRSTSMADDHEIDADAARPRFSTSSATTSGSMAQSSAAVSASAAPAPSCWMTSLCSPASLQPL